jgi:predicted RNase H-like nuclease
LGEALQRSFEVAGLELCTFEIRPPGLMEVYPHPALVELAAAAERLPYKLSKARAYWPALSPPARRERLIEVWGSIVDLLNHEIDGVAAVLALPGLSAPGWQLKAFEDAVVCAWVGACALEGKCTPYGDLGAAIWIPEPAATLQRAA